MEALVRIILCSVVCVIALPCVALEFMQVAVPIFFFDIRKEGGGGERIVGWCKKIPPISFYYSFYRTTYL